MKNLDIDIKLAGKEINNYISFVERGMFCIDFLSEVKNKNGGD